MKYIIIIFMTISSSVYANNFCLMLNNESTCSFATYLDCQKEVKGKGICVPEKAYNVDAKYCIVSSLGKNCVYNNFEICKKSAESINGNCEANQVLILRKTKAASFSG